MGEWGEKSRPHNFGMGMSEVVCAYGTQQQLKPKWPKMTDSDAFIKDKIY